jgi:hypothetical protein
MTQGQVRQLQRGYVRKLLSSRAWLRLITFRSDYRSIGRVIKSIVAGKARRAETSPNKGGASEAERGAESTNLNLLFEPALFRMLESKRRMLLIFSGSDRLSWEYEEKVGMPNKDRLSGYEGKLEVHTVPNANHVFSASESREEMMAVAQSWLERWFPLDSPSQ